jgi:hypothetical protein
MRALWRHSLAPLIMAAAVLSAAAPAQFAAAAVAHPHLYADGSGHHCPPGTNWDGTACR